MSGFVGILNLDGAPVDRALLERMTLSLAFRGPDAQETWCHGPVGLGHTLLQITRGTRLEKQPAQLDDRLWIVADARIDARNELIDRLRTKSPAAQSLSLSTPDSELILHAYDAWGDACVEYLLGDFSFAIWDAPKKRLFCARDQMGVKLLHYAHVGSCFIFSNTLDCIRLHPAVSNRLNDLAIADFLLFEMNQDPATTTFADIRRLPPAHTLVCEQGATSVRRYWELSVTIPVHFRREEDYIERFRELLDLAVSDRLRADSAGVLMSGGLDSTTVAASAQRVLTHNGNPSGVHAYTEVFDSLIPHEERHYATLTANALGIPIEYFVSDHWKIFERASQPEYHTPEPTHLAWPDSLPDRLRQAAVQSRVVLTGYGADPALCGRISVHFRQLLKNGQLGRALSDAARFLGSEGRMSRLYIPTRLRIVFAPQRGRPSFPPWFSENLEKDLELHDRWNKGGCATTPASSIAIRREAHQLIETPLWAGIFAWCDASYTKVPVEVCHPFFDLRLLKYLLALPRLPWCSDKELLREAGRGILSDAVRLRRKSPLAADQLVALLDRKESAWVDRFEPIPEMVHYVARNRIPGVSRGQDTWGVWVNLRPLSLKYWFLQNA